MTPRTGCSEGKDKAPKKTPIKKIKRPKSRRTPVVRSVPEPRTPDDLQPLGEDAFYGLAGEIVREIEPHTQADLAAVLVQLLAGIGSAVGRGPGFKVENDRHYTNLFVAIVGETASARKGSSWGQARRLITLADPGWEERIVTGASSGEGLIWHIRDEGGELEKTSNKAADPGGDDKRLFVIEPELASVLERMHREGNTLSAVLRQAWEGGKLSTLVKHDPASVTEAHVSLAGHITPEELRRKLTVTEEANGFANRFLWIYARPSKELPWGGDPDSVNWDPYVTRLERAIHDAPRKPLGVARSARGLWEDAYREFSIPRPGMLGAVTGRAAPLVRRLAVIYALLDNRPIVTAEHLRAALAVWRFAADSAALLFGKSLGDPTADPLLTELRAAPEGLRLKEIHDVFRRHKTAEEIARALQILADLDLARSEQEETRGRPATRWFAVEPSPERAPTRTKRSKRIKKLKRRKSTRCP